MKFFDLVNKTVCPLKLTCDVCGFETFDDNNICERCAKKMPKNDGATCPICGRKNFADEICMECKDGVPRYKKGVSAFVYEDNVVKLIGKFKHGSGYLKEFFADELCEKIKLLPPYDCIVYVPMTKKAERRRGYNQSKLLALAVSKRTGVPVISGAVVKIKGTSLQKALSKKERFENVAGCFKVVKKDEVKGKAVLVVDDILTTGATASELTRVLLKAGAKTVYIATVASTDYKLLPSENASDI